MLEIAKWICSPDSTLLCPEFVRRFGVAGELRSAVLTITSAGVYEARLNGERVGDFFMAPGWTDYKFRHQVQSYDVTSMLGSDNELAVTVASGWWNGEISRERRPDLPVMLIAELELVLADGSRTVIATGEDWNVRECAVRFSDIYDGETFDARVHDAPESAAKVIDHPKSQLIPQQGEKILFHERLKPVSTFVTPKGERVIDFGQEITGVVEFTVNAAAGDRITINFAEVMDSDGNFYTENYREAKSELNYICRDGVQTYRPVLSFFGFRYIRVTGFPDFTGDFDTDAFTAVAAYSDIKRTGWLSCGVPKLNRLFDNIIWSQKDNFLDVPTDCPQRNERLGWTGDAEVFIKTACFNFDTRRFYLKWLDDVAADQRSNGAIPSVVPDVLEKIEQQDILCSSAWADAATVCPWQLYLHYGDLELLRHHFPMMRRWVDCITSLTTTPDLWTGYNRENCGHEHFGDWLGLDAKEGSYVGASDRDLIASAYYALSTSLVCKAGHALGIDVSEYDALYERIVAAFRAHYPEYHTQTECAVALHFGLAADPKSVADKLAGLIHANGDLLTTGFVGTPYLLYALSDNGYTELAYTLLLQEKFPSWLFSVNQGATTIWEHWDGLKEDGSFWSADMNSFNHYAYGSVAGWVYENAAGIRIREDAPGFAALRIEPKPDARLGWLDVKYTSIKGDIHVKWVYDCGVKNAGSAVKYEITVPCDAEIVIDGVSRSVPAGTYLF